MFFQLSFTNQPGDQFEHCFLSSTRQHVLYQQDIYIMGEVSMIYLKWLVIIQVHCLTLMKLYI